MFPKFLDDVMFPKLSFMDKWKYEYFYLKMSGIMVVVFNSGSIVSL